MVWILYVQAPLLDFQADYRIFRIKRDFLELLLESLPGMEIKEEQNSISFIHGTIENGKLEKGSTS